MKKFIIPSKDTTIYEAFATNNAGLDEILEIGKTVDPTLLEPSYNSGSSRTLLYFDLPTTASVSSESSYFLNLKLANANDVKRYQKILVYPVPQLWDEGSGRFYQDVQNANDGATWNQATTSVSWSVAGGGSSFITSPTSASTTLSSYPLQDLRIDVTNILKPIVSQSLQNTFFGLILKFPNEDELDTDNQGNIKVFSSQTHTIHQPTLEIAWDSQVFNTGSLPKIPSLDIKVTPTNLKETYTKGDVVKVTLNVRDEYPIKAFDSTLRYKSKYYLPSSSYFSIVDVQSNTTAIGFDDYSKINCDTSGSYFVLDTSPLYTGRFYAVKLKVEMDGYSKVINTNTLFKIL